MLAYCVEIFRTEICILLYTYDAMTDIEIAIALILSGEMCQLWKHADVY